MLSRGGRSAEWARLTPMKEGEDNGNAKKTAVVVPTTTTTTDKGRLLALMLSCLDHASEFIHGLQRNLSRPHDVDCVGCVSAAFPGSTLSSNQVYANNICGDQKYISILYNSTSSFLYFYM